MSNKIIQIKDGEDDVRPLSNEVYETYFDGTTDSNGNVYSFALNTTDHIILETTASGDRMCTPALNGEGAYWNYHISDYTRWNVGQNVSVRVFVRYMIK